MHAFVFTLSGVPVIYYGDEIGAENDESYRSDPEKKSDSRYIHRGKTDWEKAALRKKKKSVEGRLFGALQKMHAVRAENEVFSAAAACGLYETRSDRVLGLTRTLGGVTLTALFSFSRDKETVVLKIPGKYLNLMTGREKELKKVSLAPGEFVWLLREEDAYPTTV